MSYSQFRSLSEIQEEKKRLKRLIRQQEIRVEKAGYLAQEVAQKQFSIGNLWHTAVQHLLPGRFLQNHPFTTFRIAKYLTCHLFHWIRNRRK